jgi:hypothetical protein
VLRISHTPEANDGEFSGDRFCDGCYRRLWPDRVRFPGVPLPPDLMIYPAWSGPVAAHFGWRGHAAVPPDFCLTLVPMLAFEREAAPPRWSMMGS